MTLAPLLAAVILGAAVGGLVVDGFRRRDPMARRAAYLAALARITRTRKEPRP